MSPRPHRDHLRYLAGVLLVAALYALGAQVASYLSFVERSVSPVWPPAGIALGMLFLLGVRYWPGVALGIIVETLIASASPANVVVISIANTTVAVASVVALRRLTHGRSPLDRPDDTLRFLVVALAGPVFAAACGVLALHVSGSIPAARMIDAWRVWWLGDVVGILVIAPLLLAWGRRDGSAPWRSTSFWLLLAGIVGLGLVVFQGYIADAAVEFPLAYAIIPLVLWMTLRHGHRGGTLATAVVAGIAILATVRGHGALARDEVQESLLLVATFASVMAVTALLVAASVAERRRTEVTLRDIVTGTAEVTGEAYFRALVLHIAKALEVRWAMVGVLDETDPERVRSVAWCVDGSIAPNVSYRLVGTPCEAVVGGASMRTKPRPCLYERDVQQRFPEDAMLGELGVESYSGAPLLDAEGRALGLLVVLHDEPLPLAGLTGSILTIFAAQAATELARLRSEEQRRRLEDQMRQTQKLESLGVLAGGIAHDFNNLLAGILGNASLARAELEERAVEEARESVSQIEMAARRAADLTRQMLAYSGRGAFVIQQIDLSAIVSEMSHLLASSISKKAVLRFQAPDSLPLCEGDATQLRQVVMNLITNASDALEDEPGVITVRTGAMHATRADLASMYLDEKLPEGRYVFLEVSDTGVGMDERTKARIFDPFFTTKFTGRGLGLAATLGIVRGHRGAIRVESAPGRGTTIRLLLPASAATASWPAASPPAESKLVHWKGTGRILVVDDEELVRTLASRVLEASGFEVIGAADGVEAVELFGRAPDAIRLVLLDWMMPNLGGAETLDALRQIRSDVPVILSSGYAEQTVSGRLDDVRTAFIQKPYRPQELLAKVRAALA